MTNPISYLSVLLSKGDRWFYIGGFCF